MKKLIVISFFAFTVLAFMGCEREGEFKKPTTIHWDYENPGWQEEGFSDCAGSVQSPVNIETAKTVQAALDSVTFAYNPFDMAIVDNGHTIQVNNTGTCAITLNNVTFNFAQFHFHHHSEHFIDGDSSAMEVHFVHQDPITKNLTVLGIMLDGGALAPNPLMQAVLDNVPATKKDTVFTSVSINLNAILPVNKNYYTYTGSLTTPPCSQGLQWIVFKEHVQLEDAQIEAFGDHYDDNFRPTQPLNNRLVLEKI